MSKFTSKAHLTSVDQSDVQAAQYKYNHRVKVKAEVF